MRAREAAVLSIKVLALFVLIGLLDLIGWVAQNWYIFQREFLSPEHVSVPFIVVFTVLGALFTIISSGVLWFYADKIATKIFPVNERDGGAETGRMFATNRELVRVLFGIMAVWLILNSFPQLLSQVLSLAFFSKPNSITDGFDYRTVQFQNIIAQLCKFIAGCLLLVWQPLTSFFQSLVFFQQEESGSLVRISTSSAQCPVL